MRLLLAVLIVSGLGRVTSLQADPPDFYQSMLILTGASAVEELEESEVERFETLAAHPLDLNLAGRSRLLSSGLFTPYQIASILDSRQRYGDILSFSELGLTDGFTPEMAQALKSFIVLRSSSAPGQSKRLNVNHSLTVKASKSSSSENPYGGFKYAVEAGERAAFYWSSRTSSSSPELTLGSMSAAYYGRRRLGKVILGSYNARFGQGLAQWSGFELSSLSSVAAFRKSGSGLSPSGSFSAQLAGVASDFNFGHWTVSAASTFRGDFVANATRTGRKATFGLTATGEAASADWRLAVPDVSIFGEAAIRYDGSAAAVAGAVWIPSYGNKAALQLRWYDPAWGGKYSGAAAGVETSWLTATFDAGLRTDSRTAQYKALLLLKPTFNPADSLTLKPSLRLNARLRPSDDNPLRIDLRAEGSASLGGWTLSGRYNALWCKDFAWLWYAEGARVSRDGKLAVYLRGGIFKVDNWDDRIYVYERDAPGTFNVPAYYGRGWTGSVYVAWKPVRRHSFWLRIESVRYPWNLTPKDPKAEIRLQYRLQL